MKIERNTATLSTGTELAATDLTPFRNRDIRGPGCVAPDAFVFDGLVAEGVTLTADERTDIALGMLARWAEWGGLTCLVARVAAPETVQSFECEIDFAEIELEGSGTKS